MIVLLTLTEINIILSIIGATAGLIIPMFVFLKKKIRKQRKRIETVDKIPENLTSINDGIAKIADSVAVIQDDLKTLKDDVASIHEQIEDINEVQEIVVEKTSFLEKEMKTYQLEGLRYYINDTFAGHGSIQDIPDDVLLNAASHCDLYTAMGGNHTTGVRCQLIYDEIVRREKIRGGGL